MLKQPLGWPRFDWSHVSINGVELFLWLFLSVTACIGCTSSHEKSLLVGDTSGDVSACDIPAPAGAACNPFCSSCGSGAHCGVVGQALKCAQTGVRVDGDACNGPEQCATGLSCFGMGDEEPACHRLCSDEVACRTGDSCSVSVVLEGGLTVGVCAAKPEECSLWNDACELGTTCVLSSAGPQCAVPGTLTAGTPCREWGADSCSLGLQCVITCRSICALTDEPDVSQLEPCNTGCTEWAVVDQAEQVGVCTDGAPAAECELFSDDCPLGEACYPLSTGWVCSPRGQVAQQGACTRTLECTDGHVCSENRCRPFCREEDAGANSCKQVCSGGFTRIPPFSWQIGRCD